MEKSKIAVFGISESILRVIRDEINPRMAEIMFFIDNDISKQGACVMNIPVVSLEQIDEKQIDYFVIAALSAYKEVRQQLIEFGVSKEKIQPFVTEHLCEYCLGTVDDIDLEFLHKIYFEPAKLISVIQKYREIYRKYKCVPKFEEIEGEWYQKSNLISHACGGVVNGKRVMYSNSKEAFIYSMENGFRILECDVLMATGELIVAHDYWRFYEAVEENYTMQTARELLLRLKVYPDVYCLVDVKWNSHEEYAICVEKIERLIEEICKDEEESKKLKAQVIMEVYDEETIKMAQEKKFNVIFTQYRNPDRLCFMNTVNICYKYGIKVLAFPFLPHFCDEKFLKIVTDKNIKIFCFSTDSIEDYKLLRKRGIKGIFTNYLTEKDIDMKEV